MTYPTNTNTGAKNLVDFVLAVREAWQAVVASFSAHKQDAAGHPVATASSAGFMSAADKAKLDNTEALQDGSVTTARLADGAVTAAKVSTGAVTGDKIADLIDLGAI